MTLLAVATSSPQGSLALAESGPNGTLELKAQVVWEKKAMHSELATVKLEELLNSCGKSLKNLTHIAVVNGPGSFTGIRVGVNLARTLAYGLTLPAASFNALAVLAHKHLQAGQKGVVALKAVQNFYYSAVYEKSAAGLQEILAPCSLTHAEIETHLENAVVLIEGETGNFTGRVQASDLVNWAAQSPPAFQSWREVLPLYVRASEPEEKLRRGLLKPLT